MKEYAWLCAIGVLFVIVFIGLITLSGCEKQKGKMHWQKGPHSWVYGENVYFYVCDENGRVEATVRKYENEPWDVYVRGAGYGPMVTLEQAKAQAEKFSRCP